MGGIISGNKQERRLSDIKRNSSIIHGSHEVAKKMTQFIKEGKIDQIKELIESGVSVDLALMWYDTPLILAAQYRHEDICLYLIDHGANINSINERNATTLLYACLDNLDQVFMELITRDVQVNQQSALVYSQIVDRTIPVTPLSACIISENYLSFNMLIGKGGNYDEEVAVSCMELAIQFKNLQSVQFLFSLPTIHLNSSYYRSHPLILAIKHNKCDIFIYLLNHGCDHKMLSNSNENLLFLSIKNDSLEIFEYLVSNYKWNFLIRDIYGKTLLHLAVLKGNKKIIHVLLQHGIDVDLPDDNDVFPVDLAEDISIIDLLKSKSKNDHIPAHITNPDYENYEYLSIKPDESNPKRYTQDNVAFSPSGILKRPSIHFPNNQTRERTGTDFDTIADQMKLTKKMSLPSSPLSKANNVNTPKGQAFVQSKLTTCVDPNSEGEAISGDMVRNH